MRIAFQLFFILIVCLTIQSCGAGVDKELWINEDKSGEIKFAFDEIPDVANFEEKIRELESEYTVTENEEMLGTSLPLLEFIEILNEDDSTGTSRPPGFDELKGFDIISNAELSMVMDKVNSSGKILISMKYDSIQAFENMFSSLMEEGLDGEKEFYDELSSMVSEYSIDVQNQIVRIPQQNLFEKLDKMGVLDGELLSMLEELSGSSDAENEEHMGLMMFKSLMGDKTEAVTFNLPGKVLFANDKSAQIDGNKITFTSDFWQQFSDYKSNKPSADRIIKYEKP